MNKSYLLTIVNAEDGTGYSQVKLPFLPRVGDDVIIERDNITVLKVTINASNIQVAVPKDQVIIPGKSQQDNSEIIIPAIIFADIHELKQSSKENSKNEKRTSSI